MAVKMDPERRLVSLVVRVDQDTKAALERQALDEDRSVAAAARQAISAGLPAKYRPKKRKAK